MKETDIQRYAREIAAVDLTTFDLSHPTTAEYRLAHEVVRLARILDTLREPSEAVVKAVKDAIYEELGIDYWDGKTRRILYYAVAAAEREVANDR